MLESRDKSDVARNKYILKIILLDYQNNYIECLIFC